MSKLQKYWWKPVVVGVATLIPFLVINDPLIKALVCFIVFLGLLGYFGAFTNHKNG